jgi:hypothetical protein
MWDQLSQGYSLAERLTSLVQMLCTHMVTIVDCFAIGQWRGRQMPTSVYITFPITSAEEYFIQSAGPQN